MSDFLFNGKVVKSFTDEDLNFTNDLVKMTLTLDDNGYEVGALEKTIDNLKAENEILEKDKANLDVIIETLKAQFKQLKEENGELKKIQLGFSQGENLYNLYRYKQALQEIKEIVETENSDIKVLYNRRTYQRMKQILEKCEVLKDE